VNKEGKTNFEIHRKKIHLKLRTNFPCDRILIVDEELEGLVQLVVNVLRLAPFDDEVGDDGVDAEIQLLDGLFAVLGSEN